MSETRTGHGLDAPRLKIFSAYHRPYRIFKSNCIEPIHVGAALSAVDLGIRRDDVGDNISRLNPGYCELTAQYWVWKNYLPQNVDLEWIGFCHYRRFMDFWRRMAGGEPSYFNFRYQDCELFASETFPKLNEKEVLASLNGDVDVVLPESYKECGLFRNLLSRYIVSWGDAGASDALDVVLSEYPDYRKDFRDALGSRSGYHCLTFLMKRGVFERYAQWMFDFIGRTKERMSKRRWYSEDGRHEGYVAELFFNMWLCHEVRVNGLRVGECGGIMLDHPEVLPAAVGVFGRAWAKALDFGAWAKACVRSRMLLAKCRSPSVRIPQREGILRSA